MTPMSFTNFEPANNATGNEEGFCHPLPIIRHKGPVGPADDDHRADRCNRNIIVGSFVATTSNNGVSKRHGGSLWDNAQNCKHNDASIVANISNVAFPSPSSAAAPHHLAFADYGTTDTDHAIGGDIVQPAKNGQCNLQTFSRKFENNEGKEESSMSLRQAQHRVSEEPPRVGRRDLLEPTHIDFDAAVDDATAPSSSGVTLPSTISVPRLQCVSDEISWMSDNEHNDGGVGDNNDDDDDAVVGEITELFASHYAGDGDDDGALDADDGDKDGGSSCPVSNLGVFSLDPRGIVPTGPTAAASAAMSMGIEAAAAIVASEFKDIDDMSSSVEERADLEVVKKRRVSEVVVDHGDESEGECFSPPAVRSSSCRWVSFEQQRRRQCSQLDLELTPITQRSSSERLIATLDNGDEAKFGDGVFGDWKWSPHATGITHDATKQAERDVAVELEDHRQRGKDEVDTNGGGANKSIGGRRENKKDMIDYALSLLTNPDRPDADATVHGNAMFSDARGKESGLILATGSGAGGGVGSGGGADYRGGFKDEMPHRVVSTSTMSHFATRRRSCPINKLSLDPSASTTDLISDPSSRRRKKRSSVGGGRGREGGGGMGSGREERKKESRIDRNRIKDIFPQKLMKVLSDPKFHRVVSWLPDGKSFAILNREDCAEQVLPFFFTKEVKFTSFTRKLNRWGFERVFSQSNSKRFGKGVLVYRHEHFLRDDPKACVQMRTKEEIAQIINQAS